MIDTTFVIPTVAGRTEMLDRAIESVHRQSLQSLALIVGDGFWPQLPGYMQEDTATNINELFKTLNSPRTNSAGLTRNHALDHVETEWTAFLDEDDYVVPDYATLLRQESHAHRDRDVIVFKMKHPQLGVLPDVPFIAHGHVGISFAVRTKWFQHVRFIREDPAAAINEDYVLLKLLEMQGAKFFFSDALTYFCNGAY